MTGSVFASGDGEHIELGPNEVVIRLSGDDTGGTIAVLEYSAPPDGPTPPRHRHESTDELIYVLEGDIDVTIDDETTTASAGASVWIPRGSTHTFAVAGSRAARLLFGYTPAGFEGYFEEMGAFLDTLPPGPPDMDAVGRKSAELSEIYDQTIVDTK